MTGAEQTAGVVPAMTSLPASLADTTTAPEPPRAKLTPLSPDAYALQVTVLAETHDKLRYARALLGHALPGGELAAVLDRALDALIEQLERRKFGVGSRAGRPSASNDPRRIPAAVRLAVFERDGGRCTFTGPDGHRCGETMRLEFDHVRPAGRGGEPSVENLRLRCGAHNQHEADRIYGERFMCERRGARGRRLRRHAEPPLRAEPLSPQERAASRAARAEAMARIEAMLAPPPRHGEHPNGRGGSASA